VHACCTGLPSSKSTIVRRPQLSQHADGPNLVTTEGLFLVDFNRPASKHKNNANQLRYWQRSTFLLLVFYRRQSLIPQARIDVQNGKMTQVHQVIDDEIRIMIVEPCNLFLCSGSIYCVRMGQCGWLPSTWRSSTSIGIQSGLRRRKDINDRNLASRVNQASLQDTPAPKRLTARSRRGCRYCGGPQNARTGAIPDMVKLK